MMQPQQTPGILSALQRQPMSPDPQGMSSELQALLKLNAASAAGKVSQTAPGPGGEPIPTVAAQKMQQASQQMAQSPLPATAERTATGNAIQDQQQAQAQEALMRQLMAQQQAQAQQPVLAAEGGIASLDVGGMDDYAEGGVIGYNGTGDSFVERLPEGSGLRKFLELMQRQEEFNRAVEAQQQLTEPVPATLGAQAPTGGGLTTEAARGQAPREERRAPPAPRLASGIATTQKAAAPATIPGEDLYQEALKLADQYKGSDGRTAEQIQRDRLAEYQRRGLPDLRQAAEDRIRQTAEFDAETRRQAAEAGKVAMQNAWASGILQPGARNLAELFGGAARSMIGEETKQAQAAVAQRAAERAQMILDNQIREALDKADKAAADGDLATEQAEKAKAQELANKKLDVQREMMMNRAKDVLGYQQVMDAERLRQAGAERLAALKGEGASAKPIYDTINDNVEKQLTAWSQQGMNKYASPAEVAAQRARFVADQIRFAKTAGHTITPEMEALIKGASAAPGTRENPIKLD